MSDESCPVCGLRYERFRTGLDYAGVFQMLWSASPDPEHWQHKSRRTVLGRWREIKRNMWGQHVAECIHAEQTAPPIGLEIAAEIPW